jgi:hypothetical protein
MGKGQILDTRLIPAEETLSGPKIGHYEDME